MSHFRSWPYARVLAHRGGGTLAPENTLAAIDVGRERGFRAVEFDAMLSADEVPILIHDPTLERTTNGRGAVAETSAAQLAQFDAGAWHSPRFRGEPLPTLAAAIDHCRAHDVWINLEIKPAPTHEARTGTVVARTTMTLYADLIRAGGARAESIDSRVPLLSSFEFAALAAARIDAPDIPRGYLLDQLPDNWLAQLQALDAVSLHTNHKHLTPQLTRTIKNAGYWLFCYTVNTPERARELFDWGVDAFCTDRIDLIGADFQ